MCLVVACLCLSKKSKKKPEGLSALTITRSVRSQSSNRLDQKSDEKLPDNKGSSDKIKDRESSGPTELKSKSKSDKSCDGKTSSKGNHNLSIRKLN